MASRFTITNPLERKDSSMYLSGDIFYWFIVDLMESGCMESGCTACWYRSRSLDVARNLGLVEYDNGNYVPSEKMKAIWTEFSAEPTNEPTNEPTILLTNPDPIDERAISMAEGVNESFSCLDIDPTTLTLKRTYYTPEEDDFCDCCGAMYCEGDCFWH